LVVAAHGANPAHVLYGAAVSKRAGVRPDIAG